MFSESIGKRKEFCTFVEFQIYGTSDPHWHSRSGVLPRRTEANDADKLNTRFTTPLCSEADFRFVFLFFRLFFAFLLDFSSFSVCASSVCEVNEQVPGF
jgi:hypothetical protein